MSDSDIDEVEQQRSLADIHDEIEKCKKNPETSGMFVSGWDDEDQDVDLVKDPTANPIDHILWAAENGNVEIVKQILTSKPGLVHCQDSDGYTPLHRAAYGNHVAVIVELLEAGAKVSAKTEMGWTPLHSACNWNNYQAAARLLAAGADPSALSDGEQTPLHLASAISHCKSTLLVLLMRDDAVEVAGKENNNKDIPEKLAQRKGIYAPLFEMVFPAMSYIKSLSFTSNPYVRPQIN